MLLGHYLRYLVVRAFQNIRENKFLTMVTVAVITVSMLLFSSFLLLYYNLAHALQNWGHDVQVSIYLRDSVSEAEARSIMAELETRPEVVSAEYVSKEQALETFSRSLSGVAGIIDDLGTNPLPASIELTLRDDLSDSKAIQAFVESIQRKAFEDIDWSQEWVEKFYAFLDLLRWSGIVLAALLASASIFIISQTIKLGFYARRDEFEILELVGATPVFIRVPFLIEGIVQGLTGALAAEVLLFAAYRAVHGVLDRGLRETLVAISFQFLPSSYLAGIALGGMTLGLFGSVFSVRKVVRVGAE